MGNIMDNILWWQWIVLVGGGFIIGCLSIVWLLRDSMVAPEIDIARIKENEAKRVKEIAARMRDGI